MAAKEFAIGIAAAALVLSSCSEQAVDVTETVPAQASRRANLPAASREAITELLVSRADPNIRKGYGPSVGDTFIDYMPGSRPVYVDGWTYVGGAVWGDSTKNECCIVQFDRGADRRVVLTEYVIRSRSGQDATVRIVAVETLTLRPGEFVDYGCKYKDNWTRLAAVDRDRRRIRGVFFENGRLLTREWSYRNENETGCLPPDFEEG